MPEINTIADWSTVFRDLAVWRPLVLAILRRHQLADCYACLDIRPGLVAGTHAVFVVNEDLVVKLYGPFWPADQRQELATLSLLAHRSRPLGDVRVPRILAGGALDGLVSGTGGRSWPYTVLEYLPGVQLANVWPDLTGAQRRGIAAQLGSTLASLHGTPVDSSERDQGARDWLDFVETQTATAQARHRSWQSLPDQLIDELPAFLQSIGPLPRRGWQPALLHCDITAEHVLLRQEVDHDIASGWHINGLIDFGDARIGDPEYDLLAIFLSALASDRAAFAALIKAYDRRLAADAQLHLRLTAYMFLHAFPLFNELPDSLRHRLQSATDLKAAATAIWLPA